MKSMLSADNKIPCPIFSPPFVYYFCRVFTEFKDGNIYISSALLQYSLVIAITSLIKDDKKISYEDCGLWPDYGRISYVDRLRYENCKIANDLLLYD